MKLKSSVVQDNRRIMIDNEEYIDPSEEDFLLTDIDEHKLFDLANILGVGHLEPLSQRFPTCGFVHGPNNRAIVPLTCSYAKRPEICVVFIVDTGAPTTYLADATIRALTGTTQNNAINISIQGCAPLRCSMSQKHFAETNVLGADFMKANAIILTIDYSTDVLTLDKTWSE